MAGFPMIDTGYKPEGALGALYQGFNAANANDASELELIKQYLANQKSTQLDPIEIAQAQQNLDSTAYKASPEYQDAMTNMQVGQGLSNLVAGQNAQYAQPSEQQARVAKAKEDFNLSDLQNQIYQIDQLVGTTQNPLQRMALTKERQRLTAALKESPKFMGQRELTETKTDSNEYMAELRRQLEEEKARFKATQEKPMTMSQAEAAMRNRLAANPNDQEAVKWLKEYEIFKQKTQPGMGAVTLNPEDNTLTTVGGNLGNTVNNDFQAAILAEIKRRQQQGK